MKPPEGQEEKLSYNIVVRGRGRCWGVKDRERKTKERRGKAEEQEADRTQCKEERPGVYNSG